MSHLQSTFVATRAIEDVPNYLFLVNHTTSQIEVFIQDTDHNNWFRRAGEVKITDEAGVQHPIVVASDRIGGAVFKGKNVEEQFISIFFVRDENPDPKGNTLVLTEVRGLVTAGDEAIQWQFGNVPAIATYESAQIVGTVGLDGLPSVMIPSADHYGKVVVTAMKGGRRGDWSAPRYVALVAEDGGFSSIVQ